MDYEYRAKNKTTRLLARITQAIIFALNNYPLVRSVYSIAYWTQPIALCKTSFATTPIMMLQTDQEAPCGWQ